MAKKKKSKKSPVPAIPQLSLDALADVLKIERYAHQELRDCRDSISRELNVEKATRIARTCAVSVLDDLLAYYESLPTFDERWIIQLQESAIESVVGMIPSGYEDSVYKWFRNLLWDTTYAHLNQPKKLTAKEEDSSGLGTTLAEQIKDLRDECRLTTEALAEEVRLNARTVQRHLAGKTQPYARHLRAYETAFSKLLTRKVVINKLP